MGLEPSPRPGTFLACSYSFGEYGDYLPIYIYCLLRAYPDTAAARMYYGGRLGDDARRALDVVARATTGRFEVIEGSPIPLTPGHYGPGVRFLMGREHFAGHAYGYIADIDNLIVPEEPGLVADEVAKMAALGRPYANVVRTAEEHREEMCGWHFFEVGPYFAAMQPVIEAARADPAAHTRPEPRSAGAEWHSFDEHMLYRMVKRGVGLSEWDEERPYAWINEHGFHLGMARVGLSYPDWWRDNPVLRAEALDLLADPAFAAIRATLPPWIESQVAALDAFFHGPARPWKGPLPPSPPPRPADAAHAFPRP